MNKSLPKHNNCKKWRLLLKNIILITEIMHILFLRKIHYNSKFWTLT